MDKNKIIILALIIVIAALLVCMAAMMMPNMGKQDTKLKFKSNSTLTEGDSIKIQLIDANKTAIANQTVNVTVTDSNQSDYHSVVTSENGIGVLKLDKSAGDYNVTVSYGGNDKYNGCNATMKITIEENVVETETETQQSTQSSDSSNNGGLHYDAEINVYYDGNGKIVDPDGQHPQGVGDDYSHVRDIQDRWNRGEPVMV